MIIAKSSPNESENAVPTTAISEKVKISKEILEQAVPCSAKPNNSTRNPNGGGITLVNSKCGVRIEFSKTILNELGNPEKVEFLFTDEDLILKKSTEENAFLLRGMSSRKVIYSAELVHEIIETYSLDFSEHSCHSFSEFAKIDGIDDAVAIKMA